MIIREADLDFDALAIMDGARDFASRIAFRHLLPTDDAVFTEAVGKVLVVKGFELLLAEHDGRVVGGIGILYAPFTWNPERIVADEIFWWAAIDSPFRTGRCLIDEAMKRIRERNAIPMFHSMNTSPPGVEHLYRKFGLEPVETTFMETH